MPKTEAGWIHQALFPGRAMPPGVQSRYEQARIQYFPQSPEFHHLDLDAEAIEYAHRMSRQGAPNALTRRFQVMLTLCEARADYEPEFLSPLAGSCLLPALMRAPWKRVKGLWLIRLHHLAAELDRV